MENRAAEFPIFENAIYLNTCAQSPLSRTVRGKVDQFLDQWELNPDWPLWWEQIGAARKRFARFIGAHDDEVALSYSASTALSSAATALKVRPGRNEAVTIDLDFPANPVVWGAQESRGMKHRFVKHYADTGRATFTPDDLGALMTASTAVAALPHASSFTGARLDLKGLADRAHEAGAIMAVDGFQACGTEPLDIHRTGVDVYATGTYKWLLGTSGLAFLYVRRDVQEDLMGEPLVTGWFALEDPGSFDPTSPRATDARRFEIGGPGLPQLAATTAGMDLLDAYGLDRVRATNLKVTGAILDACSARGWEVVTPSEADARSAIMTFRPPAGAAVLEALARERIIAGPRLGGVRVSAHYYNSVADVTRLFEVADAAVKAAG